MPLEPGMSLQEIRDYLEDDLKASIRNDIGPVVQPRPEGGYFAVPRSVLSYVDFLGALYGGYGGDTDRSGRRRIATSEKAIRFIKDVMGEVDELYQRNGVLLYEMFRHGTVHLYRPHELRRSDGRVLSWLAYKGPREHWVNVPRALKVRHLQPVRRNGNSDWLPVSITCLYDDLLLAVDVFWRKLQSDPHLVANWHSASVALCEPEPTNESWYRHDAQTQVSLRPQGCAGEFIGELRLV